MYHVTKIFRVNVAVNTMMNGSHFPTGRKGITSEKVSHLKDSLWRLICLLVRKNVTKVVRVVGSSESNKRCGLKDAVVS